MAEKYYKSSKRGITLQQGARSRKVKHVHPYYIFISSQISFKDLMCCGWKYVYPYFLRSTYSPSFMDLILRFDVLQMEGQTNIKKGNT